MADESQIQDEELDELEQMSDDDFEQAFDSSSAPAAEPEPESATATAEAEDGDGEEAAETPDGETDPTSETPDDELDAAPAAAEQPEPTESVEAAESAAEAEEAPVAAETPATEEVDYKAAYERIMAPFKANGREITLENPDEVVRLMQMGANYTKKMQALQPHLKIVRMLENNKLLDENKVNFLIDLDKKNPQAIQQLLRDGAIDPMELDTSSDAPAYKPANHTVSDKEMSFRDVVDDLSTDQTGKETISAIYSEWDADSKKAVFAEPQLLRIINEHRSNGIYAKITSEMDRQKMLGSLDATIPFIDAYKRVGDQLHASGRLKQAGGTPEVPTQPAPQPASHVVATRVGATKAPAANGEKAKATTAPKSSPNPARQEFNPLALSDDDFLAQTNFRV